MITAKAICTMKTMSGEGDLVQASLAFSADYQDDRNKEWSLYTPALSLSMTVRGSVADQFEVGKRFTLQFVEDEAA